LSRAELDELESFAREPGRTVDECYDWMLAHGFTLSRAAVGTWKQRFTLTDRFGAANGMARALMDAAKAGGTVAISDAATLQLSQMVFEQLSAMQSGVNGKPAQIDTKELMIASMALKNLITGKRHIEKLKTEIGEALKEAEKLAAKGGEGGSGQAVVNKVREILGIA
jgi:hypothetical protein